MAQNDGNNVAIVALIIIGLLAAGAAFLYFQGSFGKPSPVEHKTIIQQPESAPEPAPAPEEAPKEEPGFSFEHEDEDGKTEIQAP